MIVIAMIGILAAALFPNMTEYLKRARDTARVSDLHNLLRADNLYKSRLQANREAINSAQLTPNEARISEGRQALPGGDQPP